MGALRGRAGCWALRSGLRPSLQAQQPGLNYKDTTFNLFLPLRVYFYECSNLAILPLMKKFWQLAKIWIFVIIYYKNRPEG